MPDHAWTRRARVRTLAAVATLALLPRMGVAQTAAIDLASPPPLGVAASPTPPAPAPAASDYWFTEPRVISTHIDRANAMFGKEEAKQKEGLYPEVSNMTTGAGWVSLGPGYRTYLFDGRLLAEGSTAVSWHLYKMAQGRLEVPSLAGDYLSIGTQAMWQDQTQVNYFGLGADSIEDDQTLYRIKTTDVVGYAVYRATDSVHVDARFGWLHEPTLQEPAGTFMPDFPGTLVRFAADPGVSGPQPNYLHSEFAVTADTRDHKGHPTSGAVYRAALTTYSDRDTGTFSFNQYEAEALQLVPIVGKRWLLALHGWLVAADAGDGHDVPIYLQPSIGGNNTLRGYHTYRFHDRDALVANAESRWAVWEHMDVAAFLDAGNVAARFGDLNVSKWSYGGGVRLHTMRSTLARVDVANGTEGWHFVVRTTEPFRLMRISQRMADLPFAP